MSLLLTARPRASGDTFLMARSHVFFPWFADVRTGITFMTDANVPFGGADITPATVGSAWEFHDRVLAAGTYKAFALGYAAGSYGKVHVSFGGADTGARLDFYAASGAYNVIATDTFTIATKAKGTVKFSIDSKHASASAYYGYITQFALVKTSTGDEGSSVDDLPWIIDVPSTAWSATTGPGTIAQAAVHWGSYFTSTDAQNEYSEWKVWLPAGTWSLVAITSNYSFSGILTATLDGGASLGTIDTYQGGASYFNNLGTITGIVVPTTGIYTLRLKAATKHASSSGYESYIQWLQFRRTA